MISFGVSWKKWLCSAVTLSPCANAASIAASTSSSNTTVSPITMAPFPIGAKAAHEPKPAAGGRVMPSTVTATSVRDQPIFTTPSGVAVAATPLASAITF
jgi:hypothetical protein